MLLVMKCGYYLKQGNLKGIIKYILSVLKTLVNLPKSINALNVY